MSYMDVERQSKKLENHLLNGESGTASYWRESPLHIVASTTSMRNPNPFPCILTDSNLFQSNAQVSSCCPNDAGMCKSVEKSHHRLNEEISSHSIGKMKGLPSFTDFVDD